MVKESERGSQEARGAQMKKQSSATAERKATLSVREAARLLGIGMNQAYAAAHRGELPVLKIGGRILVSRQALEEMLARPTITA